MELHKLSIAEMSSLIKQKQISVEELTTAHINRIKKVDEKLKCFITISEEQALKDSKTAQQIINSNKSISPLCGIPMALKDNLCTKDVRTTCASKMLDNFIPPYDSTVYEKLQNNNSILLGKLNMDEFAMGGSNENSCYYNTKNPWDLERVPGGSSGASASSVAGFESAFSLGSDTGGSIRQPASLCGVVGLKPTYGTVSRFGLIAFASSLDQIGPITRTVEDNAFVFNAISGYDLKDSTSVNMEYPDYTSYLTGDIKGMKIGIPKEYFGEGISEEVKLSVLASAKVLESHGANVEEFSLGITEYAIPAYYIISSAEASSNLARYDGIKYGYRTPEYENLIDLYIKTRSEGLGDEVKRRIMLGTYALSSGYYDAYYKKAMQVRTLIKNEFENAFKKYDVILCPTSPTTAFKFGEKSHNPLEMYLMDIYTVSVNIAGLPAISIPCGYDKNNLPIGVQLIGNVFEEGKLFKMAHCYEQNTLNNKKTPEI